MGNLRPANELFRLRGSGGGKRRSRTAACWQRHDIEVNRTASNRHLLENRAIGAGCGAYRSWDVVIIGAGMW
jgi:hypothetical protein